MNCHMFRRCDHILKEVSNTKDHKRRQYINPVGRVLSFTIFKYIKIIKYTQC